MTGPKETNPFAVMAGLWVEAAKTTTEAMQSFLDAAARAAAQGQAAAAGDPAAAVQAQGERWAQVVSRLGALQPQFLERWLADLPGVAGRRLDAQTFSQLGRLASTRWAEELRRLVEAPPDLAARAGEADAERMAGLFQSMTAEYLRDLEALKAMPLAPNLDPLTDAWAKLLAGGEHVDEGSARTIDRLLKAAATKISHGVEYYADPAATPVGQTPREVVHREGKIALYRYLPQPPAAPRGDPVLIVYSIINRPYILDLMPGFSFVEHLLAQGLDVYLIDWGETEPGDNRTTLDSYVDPGIRSCVDAIKARTGAARVSLFGHCIGGNFALLHAAHFPGDVARIITLTTPMTASKGGVVALWTDRNVFPVDAIVDVFGHMPGKLIRYTFMALKPYYEALKWRMFLERLHDDETMKVFYVVDRWANDQVDLPGAVFRKFVAEVLHEDRFIKGETLINGARADLRAITCPVLNLAAANDWIVPPASAEVLGSAVGSSDSRFTTIQGAHVSIMIEPRLRHHWTEMSDFLLGAPPAP
jgi:polyhydroxyalkanoate synthase